MMTEQMTNLFADIPSELAEESFERVVAAEHVLIERIVSWGHASPEGFWYDQAEHEWVTVLKGRAALSFDGQDEPVVLEAGDALVIPARARHRVEWTEKPTIWLAVHYR